MLELGRKEKKKKSYGRVKDYKVFYNEPHVVHQNIGDYNTEKMQVFGINVVMARHVPFVTDGLKPGERRALVSIYKYARNKKMPMGMAISETLKIHPHGDASTYGTIIGMGQPWKNMICPIDNMGQNYGGADGFQSKEAAPRYLKVKLSKYALDCFFSDYDEHIVEMHPSYDDSTMEPIYLPAKYPNVFINGANGMAFGYATCIPYYNLRELLSYTIKLIEDPNGKHGVIAPDSPTGCLIVDEPGVFESLQENGVIVNGNEEKTATYRMRSDIYIDEERHELIIESLPAQCTAENLLKGIKEMRDAGTLNGCTYIRNNSQGSDLEIVLVFKKEVDLHEMRNRIYSVKLNTESYYPSQITVIDDMRIRKYSLKECLLSWIAYRRDFKRRYYNMKIVLGKARIHVLDVLMFIFDKDNAERTLKLIRKSEDKEDIIRNLIREYDIDTVKAEAIADMRNHEYSKKARRKFAEERETLEKEISQYMKIVSSNGKIDKIIIEELKEGIVKYGEPRKSKIIRLASVDTIPDTEHMLVITTNGFIKKLRDDVKSVGSIGNGDTPMEIMKVRNHDSLIIFDSFGRVHTLPVSTIRGCDLSSHGVPLSTHAKIDNSKIVAVYVKDEDNKLRVPVFKSEDAFFLFTTKRGLIKKTAYNAYINLKNSTIGTMIKKDDELVSVKFINKDTDIVSFTYGGMGLRYNSDSITETKRMSSGVKVFSVADDDNICDTSILSHKDKYLMIITMKGFGKKILLSNLSSEDRRSDASKMITLASGDLMMFAKGVVDTDKYKAFLLGEVVDICVGTDVPEQFRLNKGAKLIPVKKGDTIIKIAKVK